MDIREKVKLDPRMWFGFGILGVLATLAIVIGLGTVTQQNSFGLDIVLGSLATLSGGFAQWAFSKPNEPK